MPEQRNESSAACTGFGDCGCDVCCPEPGSGRGVGHAGAPLGRSGDTEPRPGEFAATALERFIDAHGDEARLALGLDVLREAYEEARDQNLVGWQTEISEYVYALESGKGLNRPL